ncbi:uncharacterized protein LOC123704971 [Colias croceus]|uniref:uncharacterized protein LOC123704971 n=1 Tax=Colias crocea TaxID=72248 RepID=UPI001E27DE3D|nr:uncharacterized protein LOC123704971 [Colias croceus]
MMRNNIFLFLMIYLPKTWAAVPGTFFWRPRLGLDLSIPTTEVNLRLRPPTKEFIQDGTVVLFDGYEVGMTVVGLAAGVSGAKPYPHLNPLSAYFYTNAYRWGLRHLSLLPFWIGGNGGSYCDTHKVWKRRFYYMDEFVPEWLRKMFPYVDKSEWRKEEREFRRFKKYAEPAFGKHYRFPSKVFNDFKSQETRETDEQLDSFSSISA